MTRHTPVNRRRFLKYSVLGLAGISGLGVLPDGTKLPLAQASNPIVDENLQPGDTGWKLVKSADIKNMQIKGYASATSLNRGGSINFYVSVDQSQTYTIEIYRMGWYAGNGGRKMLSTIGPLNGSNYYSPPTTPAPDSFGMVTCSWPVAYTLNVPASWTTGVYLAKLTNVQGYQNYIHFVVRDDSSTADLLFQCTVTTYQAYNSFGGKSLYPENSTGGKEAVKVSFDRPYLMTSKLTVGTTTIDQGAGHFLGWELPTLRFLEMNGYNLSYCTNLDLHTTAGLMSSHKAFLSIGHDEYWTRPMYDNALAFRNNGKHIAFLGANAIFWQMRFESANRVIVCYKDNFATDPVYIGNPNSPDVSFQWRELPPNNPNPALSRPENQLIGVMWDNYNNNYPGADYVVTTSDHWIYAGTGFTDGSHVPGIVGYEWDKRFNNGLEPGGLVQLSASPVRPLSGGNSISNSTIYQASSGAWVFAAGTIFWAYALDFLNNIQLFDLRNSGIQRATRNVLDFFINLSIDALLPSAATELGNSFTLSVSGSNFVNGSVVRWNGSARPTTFVHSGKLTAQIQASDLALSGTYPITVRNPDGSISSSVNFIVTQMLPTITSISPATISQMESAFTLTVTGSNFVNGATVKWNGSARPTTFVNSGQLTAQISAADILGAGNFPVTVSNTDNSTSNLINFAVSVPIVNLTTDGGEVVSGNTPGTLSYALKHSGHGDTITFANLQAANRVMVSGKLPPVPPGVNLDGGTCGPNHVIIDGGNLDEDGLVLMSRTKLRNLKVQNFGRRQVVNGTDTDGKKTVLNQIQCSVFVRQGN